MTLRQRFRPHVYHHVKNVKAHAGPLPWEISPFLFGWCELENLWHLQAGEEPNIERLLRSKSWQWTKDHNFEFADLENWNLNYIRLTVQRWKGKIRWFSCMQVRGFLRRVTKFVVVDSIIHGKQADASCPRHDVSFWLRSHHWGCGKLGKFYHGSSGRASTHPSCPSDEPMKSAPTSITSVSVLSPSWIPHGR